jgi:hypothetical protein
VPSIYYGQLVASISFLMHLNYTKRQRDIHLIIGSSMWCISLCLRCLRLVSQCWNAFIDDSVYEAQIQKLTYKRQRTLKNTKLGFSRDKGSNSEKELFLSAKVCLLSLKRTLGDLHQKDLFPYNPKPLLKRSVPMMFLLPLSSVLFCLGYNFACFHKYL